LAKKQSREMPGREAGTIPTSRQPLVLPRSARHLTMVEDGMTDLALLVLRVVTGGLLAGHGAQKLFGSFGGPGLNGTASWLESMGLRPGALWATGGAQLPVVNVTIGTALMLTGPARNSLDHLFGIKVPRWPTILTMLGSTSVLMVGLLMEPGPSVAQSAPSEVV
jgi:uncharacterized membrane protein YphA (DoxX/SURF4 family)